MNDETEVRRDAVAGKVERPVRPMDRVRIALLRGAARENDLVDEVMADAACNMGVGCGTAGVCYAERMGRPDMCGKA